MSIDDIKQILSLKKRLSKKTINQLVYLLILMVVSSLLEIINIISLMPLINLLTNPDGLNNKFNPHINSIAQYFNVSLSLAMLIIFILISTISTAVRSLTNIKQAKFCFETGKEISEGLFEKIIKQNYSFYKENKSSEIISAILAKVTNVVYITLMPITTLISSLIIITLAIIILSYISFSVTISFIVIFSLIYLIIYIFLKNSNNNISKVLNEEDANSIKTIQETLGSIRDIIINNEAEYHLEKFKGSNSRLRLAQASLHIKATIPRFFIEYFLLMIIAIMGFLVANEKGDLSKYIPAMGALVFGILKILPLMQQAYHSIINISSGKDILREVNSFLDLENNVTKQSLIKIKNFSTLEFSNVEFKYSTSNNEIIKKASFIIKSGDKVAIIGSSGSGKSTLLDLILGLITPNSGKILINNLDIQKIDKKGWHKIISHISQEIFIFDDTLLRNITGGSFILDSEEKINKLNQVIDESLINEFLMKLPNGVNTILGERGNFLSGGQKQRVGIARGLFKKGEILVLDEATSALDLTLENKVLENIMSRPDLTVIFITHKLTSISKCNNILQIKNGLINKFDSYENFTKNKR